MSEVDRDVITAMVWESVGKGDNRNCDCTYQPWHAAGARSRPRSSPEDPKDQGGEG